MSKKVFNSSEDNITNFLNGLSFWQRLNLTTTLIMARTDKSYGEARTEALTFTNENLSAYFEEALYSPNERI